MKLRNPVAALRDAATIASLFNRAEALARSGGEQVPGAEHLLLAALDLPDGSARRSFARLGVDPDGLQAAVEAVHATSLAGLGLRSPEIGTPVQVPAGKGAFRTTAPAQQAWLRAVELSQVSGAGGRRLLGAYVVAGVCELERGTAALALAQIGADRDALRVAALEEAEAGSAG